MTVTKQQPSDRAERLIFLDNLKWLLAIVVVVFHSACSYSSTTPWWYVAEPDSFKAFDIFLLFVDITAMPLFYFIAGYLALPSLERSGSRLFLQRKCKRLLVPWVIGVCTAGPITVYLGHSYRMTNLGYQPVSFFSFWKAYMADGLCFYSGTLPSVDQFSLHHFWFITLLFVFFLFLVLFRPLLSPILREGFPKNQHQPSPMTVQPALVVVAVSVSGFLLLNQIFYDVSNLDFCWVIVGSVLQFQPTRLVIYSCYFLFGLYAFRNQWFVKVQVVQRPWQWGVCLGGLFFALLLVIDTLNGAGGRPTLLVLLYGLLRTLVCFVGVLFFLGAGKRYLDSTNRLRRKMLGHSYNIYLFHYVVVVFCQYLLLVYTDISIAIKVCLVICVSLLMTIGMSSLFRALSPFQGVLGVAAAFFLLCCFW